MLALRTVLFPTDGSVCAEAARPVAERLARRLGATLHVLRVELIPPAGDLWAPRPDPPRRVADGVLEAARRAPTADAGILAYVSESEPDLIVMGTHGRSGVGRVVLGSTAEAVLRTAPCPVVTVGPEAETDGPGPVLVPVTFDSMSDAALDTGVALAEAFGTRLVALHVVEPVTIPSPYAISFDPLTTPEAAARVEEALGRWVAGHASEGVPVASEIRRGAAAPQIVAAAAAHGASLVVQASHGRRGPGRWLLGSVAEDVARTAPCPVLTFRADARPLPRDGAPAAVPVPFDRWEAFFDALSEQATETPHVATVEVVSPQTAGRVYDGARLLGIGYDGRDDVVEVLVEGGAHHVARPFAVRSVPGPGSEDVGPWALEVVSADGSRERITVRALTAVAG